MASSDVVKEREEIYGNVQKVSEVMKTAQHVMDCKNRLVELDKQRHNAMMGLRAECCKNTRGGPEWIGLPTRDIFMCMSRTDIHDHLTKEIEVLNKEVEDVRRERKEHMRNLVMLNPEAYGMSKSEMEFLLQ